MEHFSDNTEETMTKRKQARSTLTERATSLLNKTREKEKMVLVDRYEKLIRMMIVENDVEAQRDFLCRLSLEALKDEIDDFGNTIFHFIVQEPPNTATIKLLEELVPKVSAETLLKEDVNDVTALQIAASAGNIEALKVFAKKNQSLLSIAGKNGWLLVHHAAYWCREETVQYLLSKSNLLAHDETSSSDLFDSELLLDLLVDSNLHGLALMLLKNHQHLAEPDNNRSWRSTVNKLAEKSLTFESGRKLGFWKRLIYSNIPVNDDDQDHEKSHDIEMQVKDDQDHVASPPLDTDIEMQNIVSSTNHSNEIAILPQIAATIGALEQKLYALLWNILIQLVPYIKRVHDQKHKHFQTHKLVKMMISKVTWTYSKATENLKEPVLTAARLGIHEFVDEVLKAYPNSVLFYDEEGRNIFLLAVLHRKENVFNLIHDQVASIRDHTNYIRDIYQHNILHLAGKMLVPPSHIPGAALQMQRELQWFKGIEDFFQISLQEQQNEDRLTPRELFTEKHGDLIEKGEKWMRDTATSCSVVGALIITIVFAAAFTAPGGLDPNGLPIYLNNAYFRIFALSVALALFASTISVQIFLGMLTSSYAEDDFLKALPKKLIIGLVTLFLSSASMMVAFGAAFCIVLSHPWKWAFILILVLGSLPVTSYAVMQFPLLFVILKSTYSPGIIKPKKCV